jgi:hypothetical protein
MGYDLFALSESIWCENYAFRPKTPDGAYSPCFNFKSPKVFFPIQSAVSTVVP